MIETVLLTAENAEKMAQIGRSLAHSLYTDPLDIFLHGELGAGKTTFLQGFLSELGIADAITSPTYALEQRYDRPNGEQILHIDLYRLSHEQALTLCTQTNDTVGIRCIEWSERLNGKTFGRPSIDIAIAEDASGRTVRIGFDDERIPSPEDIAQWRHNARLPQPIIAHCESVGSLSEKFAHALLQNGHIVRPLLLKATGQVHDLFRFLDFRSGAAHVEEEYDAETLAIWKEWKERFSEQTHEEACATFLKEHEFSAAAAIVSTHGLSLPPAENAMIEQRLLYYSDKRVLSDRVVTLDERFKDFERRYANGKSTLSGIRWKKEVEQIETLLFPQGVPF